MTEQLAKPQVPSQCPNTRWMGPVVGVGGVGSRGGWGMGGVLKQLILNHLPKGVQSNWPGLSHELDKARKEKVKI